MVAGSGEELTDHEAYLHPDSPETGQFWMNTPVISFDKLKLTNNRNMNSSGQVSYFTYKN